MTASIHVSVGQVAATLALVALAAAVSRWRRADLERDIAVATIRSFVQLTAIGYVIKLIFEANTIWLVLALLSVMVLFGALTARGRAKKVPGAFWPLLVALAVAGASTLGLVVALGVFEATARYLVPVGGMVIGNAMTASAVALNRLGDEVADSRARIEATLAL
ncbi:MAG TPA: ABC transporter permease, partial [Solirubrobacterales bacterium]|nr:ABC transporter permease [Solirubrobacterales bacterium]